MQQTPLKINGYAFSAASSDQSGMERSDRSTSYSQWLSSQNVHLFREVICKVLDMFDQVICMKDHNGTIDIFNSLLKFRSNEWQNLQAALVEVDPALSKHNILSNRESQIVISVLQSIVTNLDSFISALHTKIDNHINHVDISAKRQRGRLEEDLHQVRQDLIDLRWSSNEDNKLLKQVQSENVLLKSMLKERNTRIRRLEKDSNVQLWEEEKKKMLSRTQSKIEEKEAVIAKLREDVESTKEILRKQASSDASSQDFTSPTARDKTDDGNRSQRHIHYLEKDLNNHAKEIQRLQANCASLIHGFKQDLETFTDGLVAQSGQLMRQQDKMVIQSLEEKLRRIEEFIVNNPLSRVDSFPQHYQTFEKCKPVEVERQSTQFVQGSLTTYISPRPSITEMPHFPDRRLQLMVPNMGFSHESDTSSIRDDTHEGITNPDLVTDDTKQVNFDAVMRHFPNLTREYVEEQWEQFCKFDKNKDYTLDLTEMMGAMSSTVGRYFSAREIKEAMLEADLDGSNTIDFYEYLNVANMLMKKSVGYHAQMRADKPLGFKSHLLQKQKTTLSRACVIQ